MSSIRVLPNRFPAGFAPNSPADVVAVFNAPPPNRFGAVCCAPNSDGAPPNAVVFAVIVSCTSVYYCATVVLLWVV